MVFRKEHADAFRDLIVQFESEAGARAIVDAIAAALTQEGERQSTGAYTRGDYYSDAAQELRKYLDRDERAMDAALKEQELAAFPETGWAPLAQGQTVQRETERAPRDEPPIWSETPHDAPTRTVTLAEHVDELRAELRGSLDSHERKAIAAELDAARTALKAQEQVIGGLNSEPDTIASHQAVVRRVDEYPDITAKAQGHDLDNAVAKLSAETGLPHTPTTEGEFVSGIYRQSLALTSGRFALIDNGLGFALVPWTPELDRHLGRHVTGVAKESGSIEWSFGRKRGLEI